MGPILTKYWSVLLSLLSGAFLTGAWAQSRVTATAMAVQGEQIGAASKALEDIVKIEGDHTIDIVTVRDRIATLEARFNESKKEKH